MIDNYTAVVILSCMAVFALGTLVFGNPRYDKTTKKRFYLTYAFVITATVSEWAGIALNGAPEWTVGLHYIVKCIDYIITPAAGVCFALQILDDNERKKHRWIFVLLFANAILQVISIFTGWTFAINEENCYCHGPIYFVYTIVYCIAVIDIFVSFRTYSKNFRRKNLVPLYSIIILACIGIGLQEFGDGSIRTVCVSLSFGTLLLFIHYNDFIQQRDNDHIFRQQVLIETDALTGMLSRYSYIKTLDEYNRHRSLPEGLAVFSIDINSLKHVNDTLGHNVGDRLILGASECISEVFGRYGKCFRVGGDEFVAIVTVEKEKLPEIQRMLKASTEKHSANSEAGLSLSLGYAFAGEHPGRSIEELVNISDRMMYINKESYYRRMGLDRHGASIKAFLKNENTDDV